MYFKSLVEAIKTDNLVLNDLGSSNVKMLDSEFTVFIYTRGQGVPDPGGRD